MSSQFSPVSTDLDSGLRAIRSELDRLQAGLEVDDNKLRVALTEAAQQAAKLRDLVRRERPDADWIDRTAFDQLLHDLEIASIARLHQQRRAKLLALASELDAGTVQHRFNSRTATLNSLRQDAVQALWVEAARAEQLKDLPGPNAREWMHWACNLRDENDGFALTSLRGDFSALERFVGEMDEQYWIPGAAAQDSSGLPESSIRPGNELVTDSPASYSSISTASPEAKQDGTGERQYVVPAPGEGSTGAALQVNAVTSPEPAVAEFAEQPSIDASRELAKTDLEEPHVALPGFLSAASEAPPSFGERFRSMKQGVAWVVVAGLFMAVTISAFIYYFHAGPGSRSVETEAVAAAKVDGAVQDSDIQKDIERRFVNLKAGSIQVTVQEGIVTLSGRSSAEEEVRAITLALQVNGVKDVRSELQTQAQNPASQAGR